MKAEFRQACRLVDDGVLPAAALPACELERVECVCVGWLAGHSVLFCSQDGGGTALFNYLIVCCGERDGSWTAGQKEL